MIHVFFRRKKKPIKGVVDLREGSSGGGGGSSYPSIILRTAILLRALFRQGCRVETWVNIWYYIFVLYMGAFYDYFKDMFQAFWENFVKNDRKMPP